MSTHKKSDSDREYVLNVARQFLQTIEFIYNPLINRRRFDNLCNATGTDVRCFYANLSLDAEKFLTRFKGRALQRIICASIPGDRNGFVWPKDTPVQTPLWIYGADTSCLFATDGIGILKNIAAVTLVAAAFDLCYVKHHQLGMEPV